MSVLPLERPWRDPVDPRKISWTTILWLSGQEFRARYRAQALGVAWSIANPLVQMGILSVVVGHLLQHAVPHVQIFVLIGTVIWQFVGSSLHAATSAFVSRGELVRRIAIDRRVLPITVVLSYAVNLGMDLLVLACLALIWPDAYRFTGALLIVPVLIAVLLTAVCGIALATAALNVIYRDVSYAVSTGLLLMYWLTPVVYPLEVVDEPYRSLLQLNPFTPILVALRAAIMEGAVPSALQWLGILGPTACVLALGWMIFRRVEPMVLDHV